MRGAVILACPNRDDISPFVASYLNFFGEDTMIAKQTIMAILYLWISATTLIASLTLPKVNVIYEGEPRIVKTDEIQKEFQREGNTLPEEIIKRYAIYDSTEWTNLRKKVDEESGYQYFYENFDVDKYGKIYLIAILINTPIEIGLQAALKCSQNNYWFGRRTVELKLRGENRREFNLRETTGTILPDSLYRSYDADGNEVYGYQILLEQQLPKPVSNKKFILRVFNHYLSVEENFLMVSEWYQKEGEGEFKYMRGCNTLYPIDKNTHLLTIKSNADIGGIGGGVQNMLGLDSIAESYLRRTAFAIKERAERK